MRPHVIVFFLVIAASAFANFVVEEQCHSTSNRTHAFIKDDFFSLETINKNSATIAGFHCLCEYPSGSVIQVDRRSGSPKVNLYINQVPFPIDKNCQTCFEGDIVLVNNEGDLLLTCEFSDVDTTTSKTRTRTTTKTKTTEVLFGEDFLRSLGLVPLEEDSSPTTKTMTRTTTKTTTTEVRFGEDFLQSLGLVPLEEDSSPTTENSSTTVTSGTHSTTPTITPLPSYPPVTDMVRGEGVRCRPLGWLSIFLALGFIMAM